MAAKRGSAKRSQRSGDTEKGRGKRGKVGSDPAADRSFGGKDDFGIPADQARQPLPDGGREKGPEPGTGPMRSEAEGNRVTGVGYPPGAPGSGSGGDLDPDFIGLDGKGGVANDVDERRTCGPDITEGGSAPFASGAPAEGKNELRPGAHGAAQQIVGGSTVDRSGGDASTTGPATGADSTLSTPYRSQVRPDVGASADHERAEAIPDNAAAGEISSDEAGGQ